MEKLSEPLSFYYYLHLRLWQQSKGTGMLRKSFARTYLGKIAPSINKKYWDVWLKELEKISLIKSTELYITIKRTNLTDDSLLNKMYIREGIY